MNNVLAVAQFRPLDVDGLSSRDSISKDELLSSMRTTLHPKEEYILGEVTVSTARIKENKTLRICFNRECMAWHYGWRSSKWIQDNPHVMDVVLLEDRKDSHMGVIASFLSTEFVITSTKKKRNDVKEEAKKCVDHTSTACLTWFTDIVASSLMLLCTSQRKGRIVPMELKVVIALYLTLTPNLLILQ